MASRWDPPFWVGDRRFSQADLDLIRETCEAFPALSRTELASTVCENLPWKAPNGRLRLHGCLDLLEQLATAGLIRLPEKRELAPYRAARLRTRPLPGIEIAARLSEVQPVTVEPVAPEEQSVWDATVAQEHPLGFQRAFGAHQRYWVKATVAGEPLIVGAFLFASAARHVALREQWLGWSRSEQQRFRARILANSRMLIRPGVQVPHLASHALALVQRRLRGDWQARYGYAPVLLETFVSPPWRGTCYRAANWVALGETTGRGRQDRKYEEGGTVRQLLLYPLVRDWRQALVAEQAPVPLSPSQTDRKPAQGGGVPEEEPRRCSAPINS